MRAIDYWIRLALALILCLAAAGHVGAQEMDAVSVVLDILKSGDQDMAAVAIGMVKDMHGEDVTEALAKELPNLSATSQVQLLSALGDRGDATALPAVMAITKSEDEGVRIAAIKAIGQLGDESSVMLLAEAAAAARGLEQKAARESLARLRGEEVDEAILAAIGKADAGPKVELVGSVGERNMYAGVQTLLDSAADEDRKVRSESIKVLKVICSPDDLAALVKLLLEAKSSSDQTEAEKTIAAVAHKIEDTTKQAQSVLAVLPGVTDLKKRASLLSTLGRIGDSTALPVLRKELASDDTDVRTAAIRALSQWPTGEPVQDLFQVAKSSENQLHRILALRGFVALLGLPSERSAKETVGLYGEAMKLAPNAIEKRRVLGGLMSSASLEALDMATGYVKDETLFREAEVAVVRIAEAIAKEHPAKAKGALNEIIENTKSDSTKEQAQEVLAGMDKKPDTPEQ